MLARMTAAVAFAACFLAPCGAVVSAAPAVPYHVVDRISASDGGWDFATLDAANGKLYIARGNAITVVNLATHAVTNKLANAQRAHEVLVLDGGKTIAETDWATGQMRFIDAADGAVLAQVDTGTKPDAAFLDPATGLVAVMNAGDGSIALVDPASHRLAGRIAIGTALEFGVADGKGGAFVNLEDAAMIARVDLRARRESGRIALPGCEGPTGLALVAGGTRLISACANGVALVVDAASGKTLATLPIGQDPDAVLVDAARGLAFIPCGGSGTLVELTIADPDHIAVIGTIPTQTGAKTGAIDPRDGRLYLPTATLAKPEAGAKRGKPLPGSFVVLVLAPGA